jgi:very-short-patch-repair endonuclease
MYEAAHWGRLDLDAVRATAARLLGRHGLAVLEEAIEAHLKGSAGTKSDLEDAFHLLIRDRVPKPIANVKVLGHEVDAFWPELRLVVEVDGPGHERPRAKRRDRRRDHERREAGYTVLRFTDVEIEREPAHVLETLHSAMNAAPRV